MREPAIVAVVLTAQVFISSCSSPQMGAPPATRGVQKPPATDGRQIVACGQAFDVGRRVVLWDEAGGFDGYRGHFYNDRLTRDDEPIGDWSLPRLRRIVDQIVIHYDAVGSSARCYEVLQKRGLSTHFMIDADGAIYQTLDLRERAWHAGPANSRSVGIEIAHEGATELPTPGGIRGVIQGKRLYQQPFTDAQYAALIDLIAALRRVFPQIAPDYPRANHLLSPARFAEHHGLIGHYHVSRQKYDPGPAFDWRRVIDGVRRRAP